MTHGYSYSHGIMKCNDDDVMSHVLCCSCRSELFVCLLVDSTIVWRVGGNGVALVLDGFEDPDEVRHWGKKHVVVK